MFDPLRARYLPELDATMRRVVDSFPADGEDFRTMLRYPLGWVDEHGKARGGGAGKRLRPLLLLLCTEAAGGNWRTALPAAAAVELLHNFSLIHDDIQDNSPSRHSRPAVWKVWGVAHAINAGDALFAVSHQALAELAAQPLSPAAVLEIWSIFNHTTQELTRGQHLDMRFETQETVTVGAYLSMIGGKSAALIAACARIAAFIATQDRSIAQNYARFGSNLGLAFQIRDDLLGIWGDPDRTGKSAATDILTRKKSLPVLYGLARDARLRALYRCEQFTEGEVQEVVARLDAAGAQTYALEKEAEFHREALKALDAAHPVGEAGARLRHFAQTLLRRES